MGKSGPNAHFLTFFLGLGWTWVGEFVAGFIVLFRCFPTTAESGKSETPYYNSLQEYLENKSLTLIINAGYIEIAVAQQLCNITINVIVAGTAAWSSAPHPLVGNNLHALYHPQAVHYSTLSPQLVRGIVIRTECGV